MTDRAAVTLESLRPPLLEVHLEQVRIQYAQHRGSILFFGILMLAYGLFRSNLPYVGVEPPYAPFSEGPFGYVVGLFATLFAFSWALLIWSEFPTGERDGLLTLPLESVHRLSHRVVAGWALLMASMVGGLLLGLLLSVATLGEDALSASLLQTLHSLTLQGIGWTNAYLLGTLIALHLPRPSKWISLWLLIGLLLILVLLLSNPILLETLGPVIGGLVVTFLLASGAAAPELLGWSFPQGLILLFSLALLALLNIDSLMKIGEGDHA